VNANRTKVRNLPTRIPSLRELALVSSKISDADVRIFERANPQCRVRNHWTKSLQVALADATRLRIRSGGTCHRDEARERTLFETKDSGEIKQFIAAIEIEEVRSGFHCMCCGE